MCNNAVGPDLNLKTKAPFRRNPGPYTRFGGPLCVKKEVLVIIKAYISNPEQEAL